MERRIATLALSCAILAGSGGAAAAAKPDGPSCVGLGSSSFAGQPGARAEVQRFVREHFEELGFESPGGAISSFAKLHASTFEECEELEQQAR